MIRVLLAEDHETVREGLRLLLNGQHDITVVGEVGDGRAAVDAVAALRPDVVVLDLSMPTMGGPAAARALKAADAPPAVVALTRYDDAAFVQQMIAAGAAGYVLKQSASAELLQAIRVAATGGTYIDPSLASGERSRDARLVTPRVTDREVEVLRLIAIGHSNKEIAGALNISVKTVEVHKANAMRKLGLRGRTDVVRYGVINGWLDES